jgi:hypothetical protein
VRVLWLNAEDAEGEEETEKVRRSAHAEHQRIGERQKKEEGNMDGQDAQDEDGYCVIGARSGSDGPGSGVSLVEVIAGTEVVVCGEHAEETKKQKKAEDGSHAEDQRTGERQKQEEGNMDGQDAQDEGGACFVGARSGSDGPGSCASLVEVIAGTGVVVRGEHKHLCAGSCVGVSGLVSPARALPLRAPIELRVSMGRGGVGRGVVLFCGDAGRHTTPRPKRRGVVARGERT